jgi:uncharacterized protein (DUF1697 family)
MARYVALLRGINVGGKNSMKMADLRSLFEAAGHRAVSTYLQSGNVVFRAGGESSVDALATDLEQKIAHQLGIEIHILLRTGPELADVVANVPILTAANDPRHLHVTFLKDEPDPDVVRELAVPSAGDDEYHLIGREVYLHCPGGYGRTKLNNALWERRLAVPATTRNWNTVTQLAELAQLTPGG